MAIFSASGYIESFRAIHQNYTCSDVVDYAFFSSPLTGSLDNLESSVRLMLSSSAMPILPSKCRLALKVAACSTTYLKCKSSSSCIATNAFSLPYFRPCQSICSNIDRQCMGLLSLFDYNAEINQLVNCTGSYTNYSFITSAGKTEFSYRRTYAVIGEASETCNAGPLLSYSSYEETSIHAAGVKEDYRGGENGACAGIVTELFVPPGNIYNSSLAPVLPAYTVQSLMEANMQSVLSSVPAWVSEECHFALRKYFCSMMMPAPQAMTVAQALIVNGLNLDIVRTSLESLRLQSNSSWTVSSLLGYTFYLPSYADLSICDDYESKCGLVADISGLSTFTSNCYSRGRVIGGTSRYLFHYFSNQGSSQVVLLLNMAAKLKASLKRRSSTLKLNSTSVASTSMYANASNVFSTFKTSCPSGWTVPEVVMPHRNRWFEGTGCATHCRSRYYKPQEENMLNTMYNVTPIVGALCVIIIIMTWITGTAVDKWHRRNPLYAVLMVLIVPYEVAVLLGFARTREEKNEFFCLNNAAPRLQKDGVSACLVQSILMFYTAYAMTLAWMMQCIELMLQLVFRFKRCTLRLICELAVVFILPMASAIYAGMMGLYGYDGDSPYCFYGPQASSSDAILTFFLPGVLTCIVGTICVVAVLNHIAQMLLKFRVGVVSTLVNAHVPRRAASNVTGGRGRSGTGGGGAAVDLFGGRSNMDDGDQNGDPSSLRLPDSSPPSAAPGDKGASCEQLVQEDDEGNLGKEGEVGEGSDIPQSLLSSLGRSTGGSADNKAGEPKHSVSFGGVGSSRQRSKLAAASSSSGGPHPEVSTALSPVQRVKATELPDISSLPNAKLSSTLSGAVSAPATAAITVSNITANTDCHAGQMESLDAVQSAIITSKAAKVLDNGGNELTSSVEVQINAPRERRKLSESKWNHDNDDDHNGHNDDFIEAKQLDAPPVESMTGSKIVIRVASELKEASLLLSSSASGDDETKRSRTLPRCSDNKTIIKFTEDNDHGKDVMKAISDGDDDNTESKRGTPYSLKNMKMKSYDEDSNEDKSEGVEVEVEVDVVENHICNFNGDGGEVAGSQGNTNNKEDEAEDNKIVAKIEKKSRVSPMPVFYDMASLNRPLRGERMRHVRNGSCGPRSGNRSRDCLFENSLLSRSLDHFSSTHSDKDVGRHAQHRRGDRQNDLEKKRTAAPSVISNTTLGERLGRPYNNSTSKTPIRSTRRPHSTTRESKNKKRHSISAPTLANSLSTRETNAKNKREGTTGTASAAAPPVLAGTFQANEAMLAALRGDKSLIAMYFGAPVSRSSAGLRTGPPAFDLVNPPSSVAPPWFPPSTFGNDVGSPTVGPGSVRFDWHGQPAVPTQNNAPSTAFDQAGGHPSFMTVNRGTAASVQPSSPRFVTASQTFPQTERIRGSAFSEVWIRIGQGLGRFWHTVCYIMANGYADLRSEGGSGTLHRRLVAGGDVGSNGRVPMSSAIIRGFSGFLASVAPESIGPSGVRAERSRTVNPRTHARFRAIYKKILLSNLSLLLFLICHSIVWIVVAYEYFYFAFNLSIWNRSRAKWNACLFQHYDRNDPEACFHICGDVPSNRNDFGFLFMVLFLSVAYGAFVTFPHIVLLVTNACAVCTKANCSKFTTSFMSFPSSFRCFKSFRIANHAD